MLENHPRGGGALPLSRRRVCSAILGLFFAIFFSLGSIFPDFVLNFRGEFSILFSIFAGNSKFCSQFSRRSINFVLNFREELLILFSYA